METTDNKKMGLIVIGMALAITMKFILTFVAQHTIGDFLLWGYIAKTLIWIWLLLIYLFATRIEKLKFLPWDDKKQSFLFYFVSVVSIIGLITIFGFIPNMLASFGIKAERSIQLKEMLDYLRGRPVLILFTCITAGIVEELLFRGYLIPRLMIFVKNSSVAVIVSALMFGAVHFTYGTVTNIIVPIFVGLVFGFHYQKYRNLKVLILCHFLIDFSSLIAQTSH